MDFIASFVLLVVGVIGVVQAEEGMRITEEHFTITELSDRDSGAEAKRNELWFRRIGSGIGAIIGAVGVIRALL